MTSSLDKMRFVLTGRAKSLQLITTTGFDWAGETTAPLPDDLTLGECLLPFADGLQQVVPGDERLLRRVSAIISGCPFRFGRCRLEDLHFTELVPDDPRKRRDQDRFVRLRSASAPISFKMYDLMGMSCILPTVNELATSSAVRKRSALAILTGVNKPF
jgi:hypothetical protein